MSLGQPIPTMRQALEEAIRYGIEIEADYYGNGQDDERYIIKPAAAWAAALSAPAGPGAGLLAVEEARLSYVLESVLDLVEKADWQLNKRGDMIACHLFLNQVLKENGRRKDD